MCVISGRAGNSEGWSWREFWSGSGSGSGSIDLCGGFSMESRLGHGILLVLLRTGYSGSTSVCRVCSVLFCSILFALEGVDLVVLVVLAYRVTQHKYCTISFFNLILNLSAESLVVAAIYHDK